MLSLLQTSLLNFVFAEALVKLTKSNFSGLLLAFSIPWKYILENIYMRVFETETRHIIF